MERFGDFPEMEYSLNEVEEAVDNLLLLYMISRLPIPGITKLEKLVFLAQKDLNEKKIKAFNYLFYRWGLGPYSRGLYDDFDRLEAAGLIKKSGWTWTLTSRGWAFLDYFSSELKRNPQIVSVLDEIIEEEGPKRTRVLLKEIYSRSVENVLIRDIPKGKRLLKKLEDEEASEAFVIDPAKAATFNIERNAELLQSLDRALNDLKNKPLLSHQEVFGNV